MSLVSKISNSLYTLSFFFHTIKKEGLYNPFHQMQGNKNNPIYILANGPSLKIFLNEYDITPENYRHTDFCVVNDFCNDPHFESIRPRFYVISDPLFFIETIYSSRGQKAMKSIAQKVTWEMNLFVPHVYLNSNFLSSIKGNTNIKISPFHSFQFHGGEKMRFYLYRKNWGNGQFGTVALNALYISLQCNYKEIYLYGIDHNFFDNITVSDENILCKKESHFYGEDINYTPIINHYGGKNVPANPFSVAEFLYEKASIFEGHRIMDKYAQSIGAKVINCTPNSWVDAYKRLK